MIQGKFIIKLLFLTHFNTMLCLNHPNPSKTVLIVKNQADLSRAQKMFGHLGVIVTCEGQRHLGAVVGTNEFRQAYVNKKISKWVTDVEQLTEIAFEEPQASYLSPICPKFCLLYPFCPWNCPICPQTTEKMHKIRRKKGQ